VPEAPGGAETFHPYGEKGRSRGAELLRRCPVTIECRAYAVEYGCARWGTWGGRCVTPNGVSELD